MKNRLIALIACAVLAVSVSGCGGSGQQTAQQDAGQQDQAAYELVDSKSGSGDVIGQYAYVEAEKSEFEAMTADEFGSFIETVVAAAGEDGADYCSVRFGDGTGIVFPGCMTASFSYGTMDDSGMMAGNDSVTYLYGNGEWQEI